MENKKTTIFLMAFAVLALGGLFAYEKLHKSPSTATIAPVNQQAQNIPFDNGILIGDSNAPVVMEEYMSFLCGHCVNFATQTFPKLNDKYIKTGKMQVHVFVFPPAELQQASLCAADQGKYEQFSQYFFANIEKLQTADDVKVMARESGVNTQEFDSCYDANKFQTTAQAWMDKAQARKVTGTPTFFVNGEEISGDQSLDKFEQIIDKNLK